VTILWTTADVARELGMASPAVARSAIRRWRAAGHPAGTPTDRDPVTDEKLYDPQQVRAAKASAPGRGKRTDLARQPEGTR
jgi:transposase-like protein